jgi:hypothetical protein
MAYAPRFGANTDGGEHGAQAQQAQGRCQCVYRHAPCSRRAVRGCGRRRRPREQPRLSRTPATAPAGRRLRKVTRLVPSGSPAPHHRGAPRTPNGRSHLVLAAVEVDLSGGALDSLKLGGCRRTTLGGASHATLPALHATFAGRLAREVSDAGSSGTPGWVTSSCSPTCASVAQPRPPAYSRSTAGTAARSSDLRKRPLCQQSRRDQCKRSAASSSAASSTS